DEDVHLPPPRCPRQCWFRWWLVRPVRSGPEARPDLLAETATLDAGLAQQLTVLLLGHSLAALLDHGAHTKCLSKPCGVEPGAARIRSGRRPGSGATRAQESGTQPHQRSGPGSA